MRKIPFSNNFQAHGSRVRAALVGVGMALLCAAPPAAADGGDGDGRGAFEDPVFGSFTRVYRRAEPAVVSVRATQGVPSGIRERFRAVGDSGSGAETAVQVVRLSLSLPFYLAQSALSYALDPLAGAPTDDQAGSGFVIDPSGLVLTNHHVVAGADRVEVRFADDRVERARVVAADPTIDVALLALPTAAGAGYPSVPLGPEATLEPGQWVMAVGSPFGLERTVTVGVVSAPSRRLGDGPFDEYIQIDATVNPGSSGGPLFDGEGRVVGINTAAVTEGAGIGFSIPVRAVSAVLPELRAGREPRRGEVGLRVEPARAEEFVEHGLDRAPGLWVREVEPGSPAEQAGIREGDLLVMLAFRPTRRMVDYTLARRDLIAGQATRAAIWRGGSVRNLEITPRAKDED